jgi:tungstate transport system substrate-binding protein
VFFVVLSLVLLGAGCTAKPDRLVLATTTSTYDSGLLDEILPDFESSHAVQIDVIAVGTGQAIALGERGDADVLLVHDKEKELAFVERGFGIERVPVMYNDFIIVGPQDDSAGLDGIQDAVTAFRKIAENKATFVSRGDQSGTHARELLIWRFTGIEPTSSMDWYLSIGQGMGETLQFAEEINAYTLTDRGTYLSLSESLEDLKVVVGGAFIEYNPDPILINEYSAIAVIPGGQTGGPSDIATDFVKWLVSAETQERIARFMKFGQSLFLPIKSTQS